jgi:predicted DNA-binding protein (MmcQ/YjbR family)
MADPLRTHRRIHEFAMSLPGAWEDHPWGETVVKAGKKVFVFLGSEEGGDWWPGLTVKLVDSHEQALAIPEAEPSGYGLGKAGWVSIRLRSKGLPPLGILTDMVEESYRLIAPKTLVAELDGAER